MAKRRTDDWQIDEWDESLDAAASVRKDPSAPVTSENWNAADDWGDPLPPSKPPKKTNSTWKWIAVIGSIAAVLVLVILLVAGSNPGPGSGTITVTKSPAVTDTPEPVITKVPDPATEALTEEPTKAPTNPPTEAPTKEPTAAPTDTPAPEPLTINCAWYGEDMRYYYHQLSDNEKNCFCKLYNGIMEFRRTIIVPGTITEQELCRVFYALRSDCPELFQMDGQFEFMYIGSWIESVDITYRMNREEYEAQCRMIRTIADEVVASVPDPQNDYEVEKAVYRWLIKNCEYLVAGDDSTAFADAPFRLGKAQCAGYSKALSLLLRTMHIQCLELPSVDEGNHQWNMVEIGQDWYNCDVTWDDPVEGIKKQELQHSYLNVPDRFMTDISHTQDQDGFSRPVCSSIEANFVYREGIYISASDPDPVGKANAEIQMAWLDGQRDFMIMIDEAPSTFKLDAFMEQISFPGTGGYIYYPTEETHCVFVIPQDETSVHIPETYTQITVHFINVGQGDAILVQCGGESLLVDAGPAEAGEKVNSYLKSILETNALDYVIATHEHDDHIAGMPSALAGLSVGRIFSSPAIPMTWWFEKVLPGMNQDSLSVQKPAPMEVFTLGGATVCFINPVQIADNPNDLSLAVRIDIGESSVLLTADIETEAERQMLEAQISLKADLLKVAHHGGNSSSSEAFIREVSPKIAVISVGQGNKHGHPHAEPLRCLEKYGAEIYRTDELGTIVCRSDGLDWKVDIKK